MRFRSSENSFDVLVVEDDRPVRRAIVKALEKSGLRLGRVFEADNGEDGLAILDRENVDFVLVDLHMPTMDGHEMVLTMRKKRDLEKLPVVYISGDRATGLPALLSQKGDGFIQKPFDPETLGQLVMDLISKGV